MDTAETRTAAASPAPRTPLLLRPRLDRLPFEVGAPEVILLRAPAGYGKTHQLRTWAAALDAGTPVRWLTPSAAEPPQDRLAAALLGRPEPLDAPAAVRLAAERDEPLTLILDGVEAWGAAWEEAVRALLVRRWPALRLWIATRAMPDIGAERLAAHGDLCELGPEDLRFNREEAEAFVGLSGAFVDPALRSALIGSVRGWPVALKLGLRLVRDGAAGPSGIAAEMIRPGGPLDRYIRAEILSRESPELQRLMLETGTLGSFTTELLKSATGREDCGALLAQLQSRTALLTPAADLDDGLAYEPLVGAYLESRLRRDDPPASRRIHTAMARWRQARRQFGQAVTEALAAQDLDLAAELLAQASDARERIGRWRAFTGWVAKLPPEMLDRYPEIRIEAGASHAILFEFDAARVQLEAAGRRFDELSDRAKDDLFTAEAILASFSDDGEAALQAGERGLQRCPGKDPYAVGALNTSVAVGWISRGNPDKAREFARAGQAIHQNAGSAFGEVFSLALIGSTHAMQGQLPEALLAWRRAESIARTMPTAAALDAIVAGYMPEVLYERDELDAAEACLARGLASSAEIALPDIVTSLYVTGAQIAFVRGDMERANGLLQEAEVTGLRRRWPRLAYAAGWRRVGFALRRGRPQEARRLGQKLRENAQFGQPAVSLPHATHSEGERLGELRLDAHLCPDRKLLSRLRGEMSQARATGRDWRVVRLALIEAFARDAMGDRHGALRATRRALEIAAGGGLVRSFADEGPAVARLVADIVEAEQDGPSTLDLGHLRKVAAACGHDASARAIREEAAEPLSPREVDVLRMVAAGLSNQELAERLFVSENTVKWHLQHIFAKLGVRNRTRASVVARELNLLG